MRFWIWLLARLGVAIVLIGWVLSALFLPSSGEREFRRSAEALKKVTSVQYSMVGDSSGKHVEEGAEIVCSENSEHRKTHIDMDQPNGPVHVDIETLRAGGQDYRMMASGLWKRDYSGMEAVQTTCQRIAQGETNWMVPEIKQIAEHAIIEKGEKKSVQGRSCREWRVTARSGPGPLAPNTLSHRSICLDLDNHLPLEMADEFGSHWTYAFNTPIHIDAPTDLVSEPKYDSYQPPPQGLTLSSAPDEH